MATIMAIGAFYAMEYGLFLENFTNGLRKHGSVQVWVYIILSGLSYFLYNEVAFLALDAVAPVTHGMISV
jgi:hypothetical protein